MFRTIRTPGPNHPITAQPHAGLVRVIASGIVIAETRDAVKLTEANYPAIYYLPRDALVNAELQVSYDKSWCPYKGMAQPFHLRLGGGQMLRNIGWTYTRARPPGEPILERLAFHPSGAVQIEVGS